MPAVSSASLTFRDSRTFCMVSRGCSNCCRVCTCSLACHGVSERAQLAALIVSFYCSLEFRFGLQLFRVPPARPWISVRKFGHSARSAYISLAAFPAVNLNFHYRRQRNFLSLSGKQYLGLFVTKFLLEDLSLCFFFLHTFGVFSLFR